MGQDHSGDQPDAPSVTATQDQAVGRVVRNHALFGLVVVIGSLAVLVILGVL